MKSNCPEVGCSKKFRATNFGKMVQKINSHLMSRHGENSYVTIAHFEQAKPYSLIIQDKYKKLT